MADDFEKQVKDYSTRVIREVTQRYNDRRDDGTALERDPVTGSHEETRAMFLGVAHAYAAMCLAQGIDRERAIKNLNAVFDVIEETIKEINENKPFGPIRGLETKDDLSDNEQEGNPGSLSKKPTVH